MRERRCVLLQHVMNMYSTTNLESSELWLGDPAEIGDLVVEFPKVHEAVCESPVV